MDAVTKEIRAVNDAYARAYATYGALFVGKTVSAWNSVDRFSPGGVLLMNAGLVGYTTLARANLARLSLSRAQLVHALQTGKQLPGDDTNARTLQDLRDAFNDALTSVNAPRALRAKSLNPRSVIPLDTSAGSVEGVIEDVNTDVKADVERTVKRHGEYRLGRIAKREGVVTPEEITKSKALTASGIERLALQGGRETDAKIIQLNKKVIGYARVHNPVDGDNPCPFCAMLMSRGFAYKSKASGERHYDEATKSMVEYHYNCHCTAEPVYSLEQFNNDPKYSANRMLAREWDKHISGQVPTGEALPAWREHMKKVYPDGGQHEHHIAAQEAA